MDWNSIHDKIMTFANQHFPLEGDVIQEVRITDWDNLNLWGQRVYVEVIYTFSTKKHGVPKDMLDEIFGKAFWYYLPVHAKRDGTLTRNTITGVLGMHQNAPNPGVRIPLPRQEPIRRNAYEKMRSVFSYDSIKEWRSIFRK